MLDEKFYVYGMDEEGRYDKPDVRDGAQEALELARLYTCMFPEVLITDVDDMCVFHYKNGTIIFPTEEELRSVQHE